MKSRDPISRTQADALGKSLRHDDLTEALLARLSAYRDQVVNATAGAVEPLRMLTGYAVTPRDGKSTASIVGKLRRQTTSLSRMQDLVGCRIVVDAHIADIESFELKIFDSRGDLPTEAGELASTVERWRTELNAGFEIVLESEWST
jgi:hypothetical protein